MSEPFSKRHDYSPVPKILSRETAPSKVRAGVVFLCSKVEGLMPWQVQNIICDVQKRISPAPGNWPDVEEMLMACEWMHVYDVVEKLDQLIRADRWLHGSAEVFERGINETFIEQGIGWKLQEGEVRVRGEEEFEFVSRRAREELALANRPITENEMAEAVRALSRRPEPNITGAIRHAIAALEAGRDELGDPNAKLPARIVELNLPKSLEEALRNLWVYSHDQARHMRESNNPSRAEAELVVSVTAAAIAYIGARRRSD
jgi:hypothetical protein